MSAHTYTCPHCNTTQWQIGSDDPHGLDGRPVKTEEYYVCQKCGNRMSTYLTLQFREAPGRSIFATETSGHNLEWPSDENA